MCFVSSSPGSEAMKLEGSSAIVQRLRSRSEQGSGVLEQVPEEVPDSGASLLPQVPEHLADI